MSLYSMYNSSAYIGNIRILYFAVYKNKHKTNKWYIKNNIPI